MPEHGGDPTALERLYDRPEGGWLDLSTGINPRRYPAHDVSPADWGALPTAADLTRLREAAADCYGVRDPSMVLAAPGTQSLIQSLPRLRPQGRTCVLSPTYNEHAHCWAMAGHAVSQAEDLSAIDPNADVVIVVNPNNPDGRRHDPQRLLALAGAQAKKGGWLVVDEAFCDVTPELSLAGSVGADGLIVLRSFGKFYGLAGLRLGFALTNREIGLQLSSFLGPWAVSTPALTIGTQALSDTAWREGTRKWLQDSTKRLDRLLCHKGLDVVGGTSLFRLVSTENAALHFEHLAQNGVLVRRFDYCPNWLRLGLPGDESDWKKFEVALALQYLPHAIPAVGTVNGV